MRLLRNRSRHKKEDENREGRIRNFFKGKKKKEIAATSAEIIESVAWCIPNPLD